MFSLTVEEMVFERIGTAEMFKQVYNVRNHRDVMFTCQMLPSVTELCTWTFGQELYNELCDHQQPLRFLGGIQFMQRFQDEGALCTCHPVWFFNTNTTTMYKKSACKHKKQLGGEAAAIFCSGSTMGINAPSPQQRPHALLICEYKLQMGVQAWFGQKQIPRLSTIRSSWKAFMVAS